MSIFNFHYKFWNVEDRGFIMIIICRHTQLMAQIQIAQGQWPCDHDFDLYAKNSFFVPRALAKVGDIKTHSSICPSICPFVHPSVTKTLTWLISSEVLKKEHWYLACMVLKLVTSTFNLHHAVTLNFFKVKFVAARGTTILRICFSYFVVKEGIVFHK